ncbi:MAG: hypothetical protein ACHQ5A_13210, partial [Opitutales bacterium]
MDKKNTAIGVLLLAAAMASFVFSSKYAPQPPAKPALTANSSGSPLARNEAPPAGPARSPSDATLSASATRSSAPAEYVTLANDYIVATFTTAGGAIDRVELRMLLEVMGNTYLYT